MTTLLNHAKQQVAMIVAAKQAIATAEDQVFTAFPAGLSPELYDARMHKIIGPATNSLLLASNELVNDLKKAFVAFKSNKVGRPVLDDILKFVFENCAHNDVHSANIINKAKEIIINDTLVTISNYRNEVFSVYNENPSLLVDALVSEPRIRECFNYTLNFMMELGDKNAINYLITFPKNQLAWLQDTAQLNKLLGLIDEASAMRLFLEASQLKALKDAKKLQFKILENPTFRQKILALSVDTLIVALAQAGWTLADFESGLAREYNMGWIALTQDNLSRELLTKCKLETSIDNLTRDQLEGLFTKYPDKVKNLLGEQDIALNVRQKLARRLLQLDKKILGSYAYELIKMGLYQLDASYDLTIDADGIYNNQLIADEIVKKWSGGMPWDTRVNNFYYYKDAVSPQAFQFILSNLKILEHVNLGKKNIELCITKVGAYLSPTNYLNCINALRSLNVDKMKQVLAMLPNFLLVSEKLAATELTAVQTLTEEYYRYHPGVKGTAKDPIIKALYANKKFQSKYTILGPMLFSPGYTSDLANFLKQAQDYKVPGVISQELINGFLAGMLVGVAGYGLSVFLDKVAGMANFLQVAPALGHSFTILAAGTAAFLTGGGLAATVAIIVAPILVSAVLGGIVGAISNTGGHAMFRGIKRFGNWMFNLATNTNNQYDEIQEILMQGLKSADPKQLRNLLYADANLEMRDNLAKMILQQQGKGYSFKDLPREIKLVIEPIRANYYNANKSLLLKLPDYILGNIMSALAMTMNLLTFCQLDIYYPGPISTYLAYRSQKKAAAIPDVVKGKSQAETLKGLLPKDPQTAYVSKKDAVAELKSVVIDMEKPPKYTPPSPSTALQFKRG